MANIVPPNASNPIIDKQSKMEQPFRAWTREVTNALSVGSSSLDDNTLITATGSSESRTLGDRFADSYHIKDFGAIGAPANDTVAFASAIAQANLVDRAIRLDGITYNTDNIDGMTRVISQGATINLASSTGAALELDIIGELTLTSAITSTTASAVVKSGASLIITLVNPGLFSVSDYCLITDSDDEKIQGLYPITAVGGSSITVSGSHSKNVTGSLVATVHAFNAQLEGVRAIGICNLSNLLINATGSYGVRAGGAQNALNDRRQGQIQLTTVGVHSATDVGVLSSNGSSIGVTDVGLYDCEKGVMAYRGGTVTGTKTSVNMTNGDGFICEHASDMLITFFLSANSATQSGISSRYTGANSMVSGFIVDNAGFGSISQFSSYMACRDNEIHNSGLSAVYSTDNASTAIDNVTTTGSGSSSIRVNNGATLKDLGGLDITGDLDMSIDTSSSATVAGIDYEAGSMIEDSFDFGTLAAGARGAIFITDTRKDQMSNYRPIFTVVTDVIKGLMFHHSHLADGRIRFYVENVTLSSIVVNTVTYRYGW